jgi:protein kinase C substrate 80K-H
LTFSFVSKNVYKSIRFSIDAMHIFLDCCDATDEFNGNEKVGGGFCTNTCLEMGRAAREEAQRLAEVQKRGAELRREMAKKAATLKAEKAERLTQLKKDSEEAEALKSEKEAIKKDAEDRENTALKVYREAEELEKLQKADQQKEENEKEAKTMFTAFDSNADGRYFAVMKSENLIN